MSFRLTARAEADLDEIDDYVANEFGEAVAFDRSLRSSPEEDRRAFYSGNFVDKLGGAL